MRNIHITMSTFRLSLLKTSETMPEQFSFEVWYIIVVNGTEYPCQHPTYIRGINAEDATTKVRNMVTCNGNEVLIREVKLVHTTHTLNIP